MNPNNKNLHPEAESLSPTLEMEAWALGFRCFKIWGFGFRDFEGSWDLELGGVEVWSLGLLGLSVRGLRVLSARVGPYGLRLRMVGFTRAWVAVKRSFMLQGIRV